MDNQRENGGASSPIGESSGLPIDTTCSPNEDGATAQLWHGFVEANQLALSEWIGNLRADTEWLMYEWRAQQERTAQAVARHRANRYKPE
ncbi:MAG: hypothetical protein [Podoviridae sp. ctDWo9]|nr:MAG: hypothetical protein [Podoviridae sp. ctDWo9]